MKLLALTLACASLLPAASADIDKAKTLGSPTAPMVIEIYSDFMCPHCRTLHEQTLPLLMKDFVLPGKAYVVSREFPLSIHPYSREAAYYAVAAGRIGKYTPVADALFKTQESWGQSGKVWETVATLLTAAEQQKVKTISKEQAVIAEVNAEVARGMAAGINSTPTIIVTKGSNVVPLAGYAITNYSVLKSLLNDMLKK